MSNDSPEDEPITVVGIGASAGDLDALREFLRIVPDDTGLAFVIVMHLAPDHESHLADVLQPHSRMPIQQVSDTLVVERNHVYVIPPNRNLSAIDSHLRLDELEQPTEAEGQLREVNRSLASKISEATADLVESEAQLRKLASDLVRAEHSERRRIADMLHDDVQQLLFGARMRLELLRDDVVEGRLVDIGTHLDETDRYIAESIDKTRHLTVELAPPSLDDDDLADTIHSLVAQMREIHGLDVDMTIASPLIVPDRTIRIVVHQTIRELLFNVVKHADVRRADVDVTVHDGELEVHVSDGGKGFDIHEVFDTPLKAGLGLATLRQRLSVVGGSLTIESVPGDGTNVRVRLPADAAFEVAPHG